MVSKILVQTVMSATPKQIVFADHAGGDEASRRAGPRPLESRVAGRRTQATRHVNGPQRVCCPEWVSRLREDMRDHPTEPSDSGRRGQANPWLSCTATMAW